MTDDSEEPLNRGPVSEEPPPAPPRGEGGHPEGLPVERLARTQKVHQRYFRLLRLSRLALIGFIVLAAIFLLWAVPWLPSGLDVDDYTPELAFTVYLLGGVALVGLLALALQELARRDREALMVWTTVFDEATGLHTRQYLYDRLSLECDRARRLNSTFSVIVLQLHQRRTKDGDPIALPRPALQEVARLIDRLTHSSDLVARLSDSEVALVAMGADRSNREALVERLRTAVVLELPRLIGSSDQSLVKAGAATFGRDGTDERSLVQAARTAATFGLQTRPHAA